MRTVRRGDDWPAERRWAGRVVKLRDVWLTGGDGGRYTRLVTRTYIAVVVVQVVVLAALWLLSRHFAA